MGVKNGDWCCFVWTRVNDRRPAPHGAQSVLGLWCGNQLFLLAAPAAFHSPWGVLCVGLQVSAGAVAGHQVVFFTLSVLATLYCRRSQTRQLNALWPSSHLENKATAIHCGQCQHQRSDKHTHFNCISISMRRNMWFSTRATYETNLYNRPMYTRV